jgi:hypothetical protein
MIITVIDKLPDLWLFKECTEEGSVLEHLEDILLIINAIKK